MAEATEATDFDDADAAEDMMEMTGDFRKIRV